VRTILLVSSSEELRERVRGCLDGRSVFAVASDEEALRTLRLTDVEMVIKDVAPPIRSVPTFIAQLRQLRPTAVVLCVLPSGHASPDEEAIGEAADFVLLQPFTPRHFDSVLRQAEEKLRLLQEVAALRAARLPAVPSAALDDAPAALGSSAESLSPVVKEFAKALSAGFDLHRVLELFLDAVGELAQPSRSAILVPDQAGRHYHITASRNIAPYVVESGSLPADGGLALWLAAEGRVRHVEEARAGAGDASQREIAHEMSVLQAVLAVPLLSRGELVAILTLGQRVAGGTYSRREAETLFHLASHLATAIRDIQVHHVLQYQKEFSERILAHMANGVISIGPDQRVRSINRRAAETLGMTGPEVLNRDLRVLPSPLGDMLYETLTRSRAVSGEEITLALRGLPLEVSTYPVLGDGTAPIGAVLVFEDLTGKREAARQRREGEQVQLLTRVVARIADEIKNPLVSIRTFMELLDERYDDAAFRQHFAAVVGRDVRRLVQMFEKLVALVGEGDYKLESVNAWSLLESCVAELGAQPLPAVQEASLLGFFDESTQKHVAATLSADSHSLMVRADRPMLTKAVAYLIWYLLRKTPGQNAKLSLSLARLDKEDRVRITVASRSAEVSSEELDHIFDPIQVVQQNLIDVGPCVSQRIIEGHGGRLDARVGRGEIAFVATLPGVTA
jgi:nitrogen-specific signal transduction histidine kinase/DNA-binding NarL/FixJ family response regulator